MRYGIGFGLLLVSFLQSFAPLPWRAAHGEIYAFLAVLTWAWIAVCNRTVRIYLTPAVATLLCLALIVGFQFICGQFVFSGDAVTMVVYVQLCLGAVLVGQAHADEPNWTMALALALVIAALVSAFIALAQVLWVGSDLGWFSPMVGYRRPGANLGQPNHLATLLVMGYAGLIYIAQRVKVSNFTFVLLTFLLLIGVGVSESRTGLLSGLVLFAWWFKGRLFLKPAPRWQWVVGSAAVLVFAMSMWPVVVTLFHDDGVAASGVGIRTAPGTRWLVWQQLADAVWIRPWLGWGFMGTPFALSAISETSPLIESFTYAHNIVLDMAIGMGIPLTLLMLIAIATWARTRLRTVNTPEAWYAVGLLIPVSIHSLFEYPFAYAYFLVPAMLAIGILECNAANSAVKKIPNKVLLANLIIATGLLAGVSIEYLKVEEDFQVARFEALNVGQTPPDYERPHLVLLTQLKALLEVTRTVPQPNMPQENLLLLKAAASRFPWLPVQRTYALAAALNDKPQEALRQANIIRTTHGESAYRGMKLEWQELAKTTYPKLGVTTLP